jgi:pyruvate dehydrogenase E1 component
MGFTRLLRNLCRDEHIGQWVVPIIPDEGRTFGMDSLFPELKIYASQGQKYEPVDHDLLLSYAESAKGQILEEGITEAGSMSSFIAAGTAYATRGVPTIPFYTFYSMFGFQRVGDLIWQAADARARGFLMGATAGRTTLSGEGLQHQDGHSLVLASTVPPCQAYDPAFAYEVAAIVQAGIHRMYGPDTQNNTPERDVFYYLTLYNENYPMPAMPEGLDPAHVVRGLYHWSSGTRRPSAGHRAVQRFGARRRSRRCRRTGPVRHRCRAVVGHVVQGAARRRTQPPSAGTACTRSRHARFRWSPSCSPTRTRARSWPSPTS